jgi:triphosphatase
VTAEIEIKLAIDPGAVTTTAAALFRHPAVAAIRRGRVRKARVVSTYLDTPDWSLAGAQIALRLRRDGTRWLQTVKGPPLAQAAGALHARGEYEWPVPGPRLDPARLATTPWRRKLGGALARGDLAPRFTTDVERRTLALAFPDGTRASLCLDLGAIHASGSSARGRAQVRRVPIAEIEIELESGNATRLFELAAALAAALPLAVAEASKAARGQALVQGRPDGWYRPVRATTVALPMDARAAQALHAIAAECLRQIAANAIGLLRDDDPEWIHQMRVGTRRLRSSLGLVARLVPADHLRPLLAEIRWLAGTIGDARDWDVFAAETVPAAAKGVAADSTSVASFRRFSARIGPPREAARAAARDAVRSPRFQQLLLAVGTICLRPDFGAPAAANADAAANVRATAFARKLLHRRHRRLIRQAEVCAAGGPSERHALRIAAKKLRYAAEFFAPLFDAARAREYVRALAALQEVLGRGNDAVTAARLAGAIAAGADDRAVAALGEWLAATAAAREPEFARTWKLFAGTRRFWERS